MVESDFAPKVRSTLDILEASPHFSGSNRLVKLLRLLVEHELESPGRPLKAYTIATLALDRRATFDPTTDSIVRVEMARLRTALKLFYASAPSVPLHIDIPKGTYRPVILSLAQRPAKPKWRLFSWPGMMFSWRRCCVAGFVVVALLLGILAQRLVRPAVPEFLPPILAVLPVNISGGGEDTQAWSRTLTAEMAGELASYPWLTIAVGESGGRPKELAADNNTARTVYNVQLDVTLQADRFSAVSMLTKASTGEVLWRLQREGRLGEGRSMPDLVTIARRSASDIGQPFGAVNKAEMAIGQLNDVSGDYACYLKMRRYFAEYRPEDWVIAKACAVAAPKPADAPSALALALQSMAELNQARWYPGSNRKGLLELASAHAEAAHRLSSSIHIVDSVAMRSRACLGNFRAAEEIADHVIKTGTTNASALMDVSYVETFMLGNEHLGLQLLEKARSLAFAPHRSHTIIPALVALRHGDQTEAKQALGDVTTSHFPMALLFGLASSNPSLDQDMIGKIRMRLREAGFENDDRVLSIIDNDCWTSDIKVLLRPMVMAALAKPAITLAP